jgi:L-alanine-DL-glutamate epimerase-like enolase superfamily enzyme
VNSPHSEIFKEPITFENGYITPPCGPGLGVELDETVAARQTGLGLTGHEEPR